MKKLDLGTVPKKIKPNPIFKGMKKSLKDPANFDKIEAKLVRILKTNHVHKTVKAYVNCVECSHNREHRKKLMKQEGFKSIEQYMEWKKIHTIIKNKQNFQLR